MEAVWVWPRGDGFDAQRARQAPALICVVGIQPFLPMLGAIEAIVRLLRHFERGERVLLILV